MARATFLDKNVNKTKTSRKQMKVYVYGCMYVCMYVCPCRARKYDQNGPYIHTYIHGPMPFQNGQIFHVGENKKHFLTMQGEGNGAMALTRPVPNSSCSKNPNNLHSKTII